MLVRQRPVIDGEPQVPTTSGLKPGMIFLTWPNKSSKPSLKRVVVGDDSDNNKTLTDLYTVLVIDNDAPFPENPCDSPYLHYLRVNVGGPEAVKSTTVVPFMWRKPAQGIIHRFYAIAYLQTEGEIDVKNLGVGVDPKKFDLRGLVNANHLVNQHQVLKLLA
jgi:hypothetical protein